jgi:REP element-mobilizing transposase RayT
MRSYGKLRRPSKVAWWGFVQTAQIRDRGRLPHWDVPEGTYFVTFRLAGSLPAHALEALRQELKLSSEEKAHPQSAKQTTRAAEIEKLLDSGLGPKHLLRPEIAEESAQTLQAFDGVRYEVSAWCVMPNHVHVVFCPLGDWDLARVVHSWKSFTAHEIDRKFGIPAPFWHREYYDHLIRDGEEFRRAVDYVVRNPEKAGLTGWRWFGASSSAGVSPASYDLGRATARYHSRTSPDMGVRR